VKTGMRARELRLGRAFRRIVTLALAAAPCAAACHAATDTAPRDASVDHEPDEDAAAPDADAPDADAADTEAADADAASADAASCALDWLDAAEFEDGDACSNFRLLPCGIPDSAPPGLGCLPELSTCAEACDGGGFLYYCQLAPTTCDDGGMIPGAEVVIECVHCDVGAGRRPRGLCSPGRARAESAGDHFASMAHLESASVRAFGDLERSLVALGAPPRLAAAARRAACDERRHARAVARLARRFGSSPPRPRVHRRPPPTIFDLLEDGVVEGCVGETFGALLLTWQAEHAEGPRVRRTLRAIARDETRHAALAWEIWRWGAGLVGPAERRTLRRTLDRALAALERRALAVASPAVQRVAGVPPPEAARSLVRELARLAREEATRAILDPSARRGELMATNREA
jgi:P-aminobenzoate N-oxygenase AurF